VKLLTFAVFIVIALPAAYAGEEAERALPDAALQQKLDTSVESGLAYIAANQNRDGSWGGGSGSYSRHVGITGLCALALMANGNVPGRGRYGKQVEGGIRYLLNNVSMTDRPNRPIGYIGGINSRMYGHGFAALCLAEAYGMSANRELGRKLKLTIDCIIRSQHDDGGWRYQPSPVGDSDLSVTICQVQALRAARNAGIKVPKETIQRAIDYTKKSAQPSGRFSYMLRSRGGSLALAGAGVTALYGTGEYGCPEAERGVKYLRRNLPGRTGHYYYGHYYISQALYQAGGEAWEDYFRRGMPDILAKQQPNGSWTGSVGSVYCTAMACLSLQVHNGYLPIFQR